MEEIKKLSQTETSNEQIKRAFLFSCMTGLRWADVKTLLWKHIRLSSKELKKEQTKVEGEGKTLRLNLNSTAIKLLEEQGQGKPDEPVFTLPSANGANKTLKAWVKRAKIQKDITWHCARHSAGTNLIFNGADVTTVSSILGHTSLKHTQRYVREAKALKEKATDSLSID
jgi:integrase